MKKRLFVFIPVFTVIVFIFTAVSPYVAMSEDISTKILRLHILANSDSEYDQRLKLKVRDEILKASETVFDNCMTLNDAIQSSQENIDYFSSISRKVLSDNDCDYPVYTYVAKEYFDTREYDDFTLPSGVYNTIKVVIGSGSGHNWWCVMFPQVCLNACSDDLDSELTDEEIKYIKDKKFIIKFKTVEIYEKLKYKILS